MRPREIIFLGNFGTQNLGNECTLHATIYNTVKRIPDAQLKCVCTVPQDTMRRHNIPAFNFQAVPIASPEQPLNGQGSSTEYGSLMKFLRKLFLRISVELQHWAKA